MAALEKALLRLVAPGLLLLGQASEKAATPEEEGIPVSDSLVIAKCGTCHSQDARGNMDRISWERSTPEGWQEAIKKTILENRVALSPAEARSIVKYLSGKHGLAPEEARPVMYYPERRIHDETAAGNSLEACAKCHPAARPLSWRRSLDDWKQFVEDHRKQYEFEKNAGDSAIAFLAKAAPLHTPEWASWSPRLAVSNPMGRWLVTAYVQGRGQYAGEMVVSAGSAPEGFNTEFNTRVTLRSVRDGSTVVRTGQTLLFGGYAWRGRSKGTNNASSPDDPSNEAREALWLSPDGTKAEGRWFWGQYQEFGFDVEMRRASAGATLLAIDRPSLKIGSKANSMRLIGDNMPSRIAPGEVNLGPGIIVRRIVPLNSTEAVAEVDVAANAAPGKRNVRFKGSALKGAMAIYDRVDYIKVAPESSLAGFGGQNYARGFGQFEAIAYQRGPDGKLHTADDLELGPIDVTWSMEVFYAVDTSGNDKIGRISPAGLFTPAGESPGANYDIWVIATSSKETNAKGQPLVGKGYVVVTVPEYMFNGRRYVRVLVRWIPEGTW
jgi:quinohemoprotein amine dehydrogenase